MLLKEIEEEIDEMEADIVKTLDYHDVIFPLESRCNDDWQRASDMVSGARIGLAMWIHIQAD